jgi:V-type H+-transporting ATPase subunit a
MVRSTKKTYRSEPVECRDVEYLYKARYMLMMMGLFSVFCGFIYNDFFSISLDYSSTCFNGKLIDGCTPLFGFDGAWGSA